MRYVHERFAQFHFHRIFITAISISIRRNSGNFPKTCLVCSVTGSIARDQRTQRASSTHRYFQEERRSSNGGISFTIHVGPLDGFRFTCEARASRNVINGLKAREDLSDMAHFLFPFCSVSLFFFSFIFFSFFFFFSLSTKRLSVGEVCQSRATVPMRSRFISGTSE